MSSIVQTVDGSTLHVEETIGDILAMCAESNTGYIVLRGMIFKRIMVVIANICSVRDC